MHDAPELLTLAQAARELGIKPPSVRQAIFKGRLAGHRVESVRGPYWTVSRAELERYRAEHLGMVWPPARRAHAGQPRNLP